MDSNKNKNPFGGTTDPVRQQNDNQKLLKKQAIRNLEYNDMVETFDELYRKGKNGEKVSDLMEIIRSDKNIRLAYRNLRGNKGSRTPGTDGMTISELSEISEEKLIRILKDKFEEYEAAPVRRKEIPKPGTDRTRPPGIPVIPDRLIQQCVKQVLEPYLEAKFYPYSFGYRPDKGVEQAMHRVYHLAQVSRMRYVVDIDIKGFFDNVDHNRLRKQLWSPGIRDRKLLSIINEMLKAPIQMPEGELVYPEKGTPQGGIISPLLANVVLNESDWWIASQWEEFPAVKRDQKEYSSRANKYQALRKSNLKEMYGVRYADDIKIFVPDYKTAVRVKAAVTDWFEKRLKLEVSPEKTGITDLRKNWSEFLGFRFKLKKKGSKEVIVSHMSKKAIALETRKLKEQIKAIEHAGNHRKRVQEIRRYNSMVMGIHEYYRMATDVSTDLAEINRSIRVTLHNRILKNIRNPGKGEIDPKISMYDRYRDSKQLRFLEGQPILPIAYCKTDPPKGVDREFSRFTPEGRNRIHRRLGVDLTELFKLMCAVIYGSDTIEFLTNRTAKYCARYGRCFVTGTVLKADQIHCHHILPEARGPDDSYDNLVIVSEEVHRLIHAKEVDIIMKYLHCIKNEEQLKKLNFLRRSAGSFEIRDVVYGNGIQLNFFEMF